LLDGIATELAEIGDVDFMFAGEIQAELFAIDFDGAHAAAETEAKEAAEASDKTHGFWNHPDGAQARVPTLPMPKRKRRPKVVVSPMGYNPLLV